MLKLTGEGYIEHRGHQVWWGFAGGHEVADRVPILTIHGGPGMPHDCLEPLAALGDRRRVIFYDQYGCGRPDRAADPTDYDISLFVYEVDALRRALGLTEVHLFAHSYGGPLALEYLLSAPRAGVRSLILSNTFASVPALATGWTRRLTELGGATQQALAAGPSEGDGGAYGAALGEFIDRFVLPLPPPEPMMRTQMGFGAEVYTRMHGSSGSRRTVCGPTGMPRIGSVTSAFRPWSSAASGTSAFRSCRRRSTPASAAQSSPCSTPRTSRSSRSRSPTSGWSRSSLERWSERLPPPGPNRGRPAPPSLAAPVPDRLSHETDKSRVIRPWVPGSYAAAQLLRLALQSRGASRSSSAARTTSASASLIFHTDGRVEIRSITQRPVAL